MKQLFFILLFSILTFSCGKTTPEKQIETTTQEVAAAYKSIELEIEGMTCEIGCAKLIQSKLYKVDGITYSKVSFENRNGQVTYDANKLSPEDIIKKVNGIAGGDLYSVVNTQELQEVIQEVK